MAQILNKILVNPEESEKLQLYLFKKGYAWNSGSLNIMNIDSSYICIYSDKTIVYSDDYNPDEEKIIKYEDFIKISLMNDKMFNTKSGEKLVYIGKSPNLTFLKYEQVYEVTDIYFSRSVVYNKYFVLKNNKDSYDIREDNMYNFIKLKEYRKIKLNKLNNN